MCKGQYMLNKLNKIEAKKPTELRHNLEDTATLVKSILKDLNSVSEKDLKDFTNKSRTAYEAVRQIRNKL